LTYDRRKDTSYLKRPPLTLDRKAGDSEKEQMERPSVVDTKKKRSSLKDIIQAIKKNNSSVTDIDTRRLDNINNLDNLHKLRQIVRNRAGQVHHKVLHTEAYEHKDGEIGNSKNMEWEKKGGPKSIHGGHAINKGMKAIQKANAPTEANVVRMNDQDAKIRKANWEEDKAKAEAKGKDVPDMPRFVQTNKTNKKSTWTGPYAGPRKKVT